MRSTGGSEIEDDIKLNDLMSRDDKGMTALHIASSKGNKNKVDKLFAFLGDDGDKIAKYVKETDYLGRSPLQMASRGGHIELVKVLLGKAKWDPLKERDVKGRTALHYAAQAKDPKDAVAICQELLQSCIDPGERSLLLWASAGGIGTADEGGGVNPIVKTFLQKEKTSDKTHLLREAALRENVEMAWELVNRGADIDDLRDPKWNGKSQHSVKRVLRQLEFPKVEDRLGTNDYAEGLAALLLNRFVKSRVTVGICAEWGMGRSNLMRQTEKILLITAAQLTFPNLLKSENFVGVKKISLSRKGRRIYETFRKGAFSLLNQKEQKNPFFKISDKIKLLWRNFVLKEKGPLVNILKEYKPKYHSVYKSLACMDSYQMLDSEQPHALGRVPRVLTVSYNAWPYHDRLEAWAGLAVTITKELEKSMTRTQWFTACWRYTWNKNNLNICFQVLLPCFLATFLAAFIAWAAWILLKQTKFQSLKYGSITLTLMTAVWIVLRSIVSAVKPVSVQMMGYVTSPDHTSRLAYQEQVISDINFLKTELGKSPHWFFSLVLGEWCWNWFGLFSDNAENTNIRKFKPASEDQLRIITFVDDLDRCEEKVIVQVLSAVHMVLARCKINVVLGIDHKMFERAIRRNIEEVEGVDIVDKFVCKIMQIPLSLQDPTDDHIDNYLKFQLGREPQTRSSFEDDTDDDVADAENKENGDQTEKNTVVDIDSCDQLVSRCRGIFGKVLNWLSCFLKISYSIACNISSELQSPRDQPDALDLYPLTRDMLISKYTEEEVKTFENLKIFATGVRKLPREWKRLFNYHTLAWNVLTNRGKVHCLSTWKVELVAWIFVCWQWKNELNIIIKGWSNYTEIETASSSNKHEDNNAGGCNGPPLSEIVRKCVHAKSTEKSKEPMKKDDDCLEVRGCLKPDNSLSLYVQKHAESNVEEDRSQKSWAKLQEALSIQDVSMKGIQLFQQFRFHCETDHVPWPPRNKSKAK